jgi:hypothetical protein
MSLARHSGATLIGFLTSLQNCVTVLLRLVRLTTVPTALWGVSRLKTVSEHVANIFIMNSLYFSATALSRLLISGRPGSSAMGDAEALVGEEVVRDALTSCMALSQQGCPCPGGRSLCPWCHQHDHCLFQGGTKPKNKRKKRESPTASIPSFLLLCCCPLSQPYSSLHLMPGLALQLPKPGRSMAPPPIKEATHMSLSL